MSSVSIVSSLLLNTYKDTVTLKLHGYAVQSQEIGNFQLSWPYELIHSTQIRLYIAHT